MDTTKIKITQASFHEVHNETQMLHMLLLNCAYNEVKLPTTTKASQLTKKEKITIGRTSYTLLRQGSQLGQSGDEASSMLVGVEDELGDDANLITNNVKFSQLDVITILIRWIA